MTVGAPSRPSRAVVRSAKPAKPKAWPVRAAKAAAASTSGSDGAASDSTASDAVAEVETAAQKRRNVRHPTASLPRKNFPAPPSASSSSGGGRVAAPAGAWNTRTSPVLSAARVAELATKVSGWPHKARSPFGEPSSKARLLTWELAAAPARPRFRTERTAASSAAASSAAMERVHPVRSAATAAANTREAALEADAAREKAARAERLVSAVGATSFPTSKESAPVGAFILRARPVAVSGGVAAFGGEAARKRVSFAAGAALSGPKARTTSAAGGAAIDAHPALAMPKRSLKGTGPATSRNRASDANGSQKGSGAPRHPKEKSGLALAAAECAEVTARVNYGMDAPENAEDILLCAEDTDALYLAAIMTAAPASFAPA